MISSSICAPAPMTPFPEAGRKSVKASPSPRPRPKTAALEGAVEHDRAASRNRKNRHVPADAVRRDRKPGVMRRGYPRLLCVLFSAAIAGTVPAGRLFAQPQTSIELIDPKMLRVCADPHNMPFSTDKGEGFENKLAELLAAQLGKGLTYAWYPQ